MTTINYTDSIRPESSAIDAMFYDASTFNLYVRFRNSQRLAGYKGVSETTWAEIVKESNRVNGSVGKYYNAYIQGVYNGISVDQNSNFKFNMPKQEAPKPEPKPEHKFSITVDFTQKFDIDAATLEEALETVKAAIERANIVESFEIRKAEVVF